ncbi:unnamed protein product, partial [Trichobilharzia regenti]
SDDSDSEAEQSGFGRRDAGLKRKGANYSAPITFVSGGLKVGSNYVKRQASYQSNKPANIHVGSARRAAMAAAGSKSAASGFGAWEKHTKGIGMKLLEQMGYEPGKGLGSEGQGIVTPVEAVQRVGKVSVGFYGPEKTAAPRRGNEAVTEKPNSGMYIFPKCFSFTVKHFSVHFRLYTIVKLRIFFLSELSKVKVIDMTSKEQKVYSGYEAALSHDSTLSDDEEGTFFDCPALRHNFALVMRTAEDEIRKYDSAARFEEDRAVGLEHEIEKLTEVGQDLMNSSNFGRTRHSNTPHTRIYTLLKLYWDI